MSEKARKKGEGEDLNDLANDRGDFDASDQVHREYEDDRPDTGGHAEAAEADDENEWQGDEPDEDVEYGDEPPELEGYGREGAAEDGPDPSDNESGDEEPDEEEETASTPPRMQQRALRPRRMLCPSRSSVDTLRYLMLNRPPTRLKLKRGAS